MTDEPTSVYYEEPYEDWRPGEEQAVEEEAPRRPRRRIVTPVTLVLGAILVAALGFFGGVKAQKHSDAGSSGSGANAAATALAANGAQRGAGRFPGGGQGQPPGGGAAPTFGTVASKDGSTLYVKDSNGNTVKVKATSNSKITRNAPTGVGGVHPGDTVIVQGSESSSGTVTATQITATASGATGGIGGLFGGGGGGFPGGGQFQRGAPNGGG